MECIKIQDNDSVAVAVRPLDKGENVTVCGEEIILKNDIPAGHKFALKNISKGENIIKYSYAIGHAVYDIKQ